MRRQAITGHLALAALALTAAPAPLSAQTASVWAFATSGKPSTGSIVTDTRASSGPSPQSAGFDADEIFSFFGKAAAASSAGLAVRARTDTVGNPLALDFVEASDIQYRPATLQPISGDLAPLEEFTNSLAMYDERVTANSPASALLNGFFDHSLTLAIGRDPAIRQALLEIALRDVPFTPDPDPDKPTIGEIHIGSAEVSAYFDLGITGPIERAILSVASTVIMREIASYSRFGRDIDYLDSRFETFAGNSVSTSRSGDGPATGTEIISAFDFPGTRRFASNYSLPFDFVGGVDYDLRFSAACLSITAGVASFDSGTTASCDASRSGYWNGLTNVRGPDGNPLSDFRLTGASGFDFRGASPFSPAPATDVTGVPEPGQWALLLVGFAVTAAALRRRRTSAVAEAA